MENKLTWIERWQAALRRQHQLLFDYETKSLKTEYAEHVNCPVCDSSDAKFLFEKDWFCHVQCLNCSMVYMNPRMNQAATHSFYNSDVNAIYNETKFDQVSSSTQLDDQINLRNLKMIDRFRRGERGNLLEIGSAKGYLLSKAKERGYTVYGLELNQKNYQYSHAQLGDNVMNVDLLDAHFEDNQFDVVYMRDVVEHIPSPKEFFEEVSRVTKPGGILFIDTHNIDGWIYRIVQGRHTVIFGFEHPVHWSPHTLKRILSQHGFVVHKVSQSSLDFMVFEILYYFMSPSFTTIYPKPPSRATRRILKILLLPFRFKLVRWIDKIALPQIANFFGKGSVMKVIAEKVNE